MAKFTPKQRIRAASTKIGQTFDQYKGDEIYMGFTGRGDAAKTVLVPNKPGFIFVRIPKVISGNDLTEYTEQIASSTSEFRHNVAVVVARSKSNPSVFEIKGLWPIASGRGRIQTVGESVGLHRSAHELFSPHGGHDPVFIDTLQIRNLLVTPTSPPSSSVVVGGGWYIWKDRNVHWFDGTTVELSENVPSGSFAAYVSLWLDPTDQSIIKTVREQQIVGWELTKEDLVVWPDEGYIPLACIRLTTLNYQVVWSDNNIANFIDMRPHQSLMPGDMLPAGHPLDPSGGYHSGTLDAVHISLRDPSGGFIHDNLHDILEDEVMHWTGTLRTISEGYIVRGDEIRQLDFEASSFSVINHNNGVVSVTGTGGAGGNDDSARYLAWRG